MPDTPATAALTRLRTRAEQVEAKQVFSEADIQAYLQDFEAYECWQPFLVLLQQCLQRGLPRRLFHYIKFIRTQNLFLDQPEEGAGTCKRLIDDLKMSFSQFSLQVLPEVLKDNDFKAEAHILQKVYNTFPHNEDKVRCLERLCLLYDKKLHNEAELNKLYEKILRIDPANLKALRYFKVMFTQNGAWEDVTRILLKMLSTSHHPQETYRTAQELAGVYLYQMGDAAKAIEIIELYCMMSPLDTSTLHYDAYAKLGDWQGCLKVLQRCLANVEDDHLQAILHYRIAQLFHQTGQQKAASDSFLQASSLWPQFLEPLEELIALATEEKDWYQLKKLLEHLWTLVQGEEQKQRVTTLLAQLNTGLEHGRENIGS